MTNQTTPIKPENLDSTRLHSPEEVKQWKADTADYFSALRAIENAKVAKAQAQVAYANRTLTSDEYHELAVKREADRQAKQAERETAEKTAALAEIDRKMASPDTVEVMNRSEYNFLLEVIMWSNRGYTLQDNGIHHFGMGLYHVQLTAPAKKKASAK